MAGRVCRQAESHGLNAAGFYRTGANEKAVMNTRGTWAYHRGTFAGLLITARSESSAAWAKGSSWRMKDIEVPALINEATEKALRGRDPQTVEPGEYAVVLSPYAVDDILGALSSYGMSAQMVQDGRSWMIGLMGKSAMSPLISIWDDGCDLNGRPMPFDAEGVPKQRVSIVTDGVVGEPVYNFYTAGKEGRLSTGHQGGPTGGPSASNLFMKPGDQSVDQMIESTEHGLFITRFFYNPAGASDRLRHDRHDPGWHFLDRGWQVESPGQGPSVYSVLRRSTEGRRSSRRGGQVAYERRSFQRQRTRIESVQLQFHRCHRLNQDSGQIVVIALQIWREAAAHSCWYSEWRI